MLACQPRRDGDAQVQISSVPLARRAARSGLPTCLHAWLYSNHRSLAAMTSQSQRVHPQKCRSDSCKALRPDCNPMHYMVAWLVPHHCCYGMQQANRNRANHLFAAQPTQLSLLEDTVSHCLQLLGFHQHLHSEGSVLGALQLSELAAQPEPFRSLRHARGAPCLHSCMHRYACIVIQSSSMCSVRASAFAAERGSHRCSCAPYRNAPRA
jgi:hypothetical protein